MGWSWKKQQAVPNEKPIEELTLYCVKVPGRNGAEWTKPSEHRFQLLKKGDGSTSYLEGCFPQDRRPYRANRLPSGETLVKLQYSALDSIQVDAYTRQRDISGNGPVVDELWFSTEALANVAAGSINAALRGERLNRKVEREEALTKEHGELSGYPTDLLIDGR